MSREFIKSLTYKNGKVFTRQCSSNVNPKYYYSEEHKGLTKLYNELGEKGFEKWFLNNCIMTGEYVILKGCNQTLRKLNYFSNLLWNDKNFINLSNQLDSVFDNLLKVVDSNEKEKIKEEYQKVEKDIEIYVSSFYDKKENMKEKER